MKKYDIIYSLGSDCGCASYMKKTKLRITSGPFDWITHADFITRLELILNNFDGFMELKNFKFLEKSNEMFNDKDCDYYENTLNKLHFYHDFPKDQPLEKSFPKVSEKYNRRIKRFYKNIREKNKILLIWFTQEYNTPNDEILEYTDKICKKFNKKIDFLIIEHKNGVDGLMVQQVSTNVIKYICHTIGPESKNIMGNEKECLPIFEQYQLIIPHKAKIKQTILKLTMNIICFFIYKREIRHKVKSFINEYY